MVKQVIDVNYLDSLARAVSFDTNTGIGAFEYDKKFIKKGIELSPIMMPLSQQIYSFPTLESQTFKGNDIKLAGKEGLTVKSKKGIHAFINDGTGVNHPNGKRAVTTFHEGFGHGLSILNGLKGKANDDNAIRYDNMIRRVMGFSNFRDGTKHGGLTPVVSPNILPAYR